MISSAVYDMTAAHEYLKCSTHTHDTHKHITTHTQHVWHLLPLIQGGEDS